MPASTVLPASRRRSTRLGQLLREDAGVSLIEVMIAAFIFTVAILGVASVATGTLQSVTSSQARQEATTAVTRALESTRSLNFDLVALRTGEYTDGTAYDWDGPTGSAPSEPQVAEPDGAVRNAYPYVEARNSYSLVTIVTEFLVERPDGQPVAETARRVTAVATLTGGGEVRQSTVIARADRGLPNPNFSISPVTGQRVAVPDGAGNVPEVCFTSRLTNNGAADSYEFVLPSPSTHPLAFQYSITAYIDLGTVGVHDAGDQLLSDQTGNGASNPDTATPLPTNESHDLLFCYDRTNPIAYEDVTFTVTARSLYDTDVSTDLQHQVVVDDELTFYPKFDLGDDPPPSKGGNFPMTTAVPTATTYADYDTDGRPGTYLERNKSDYRLIFSANLPAGATIGGGTITTTIWAASKKSTVVGESGDDKTLKLRYTLEVVDSTGAVVQSVVVNGPDFVDLGNQWNQRTIGIAFPSHTVSAGDRLRLTVDCRDSVSTVGGGREHCHMMYDTTNTPASVTVPLS